MHEFREIDGKKISDGQTVCGDHSVQVFKVTIRSLNGVPMDVLNNLIQQKFEVVGIELDSSIVYGRAGMSDFIGE